MASLRRLRSLNDAEIIDRLSAFDSSGRLILWTPEAVQGRLVEAASVFARMPARIGPKQFGVAWPQVLIVAQDLVDDETQERLMRFPHLVGDWESHIDDKTKKRLSENKAAEWNRRPLPDAAELSRAEEALRWPAVYLADKPLLADALTLWALCLGTGASLRLSLRKRAKEADAKMRAIGASRRQEAVPNKNFHQELTWRRRKEGAEIICAGLRGDKIAVREAPEDVSNNADA